MYRPISRCISVLVMFVLVGLLAQPAFASIGIDLPAFQRVWERQDRVVVEQAGQRSWTWGPAPFAPSLFEPFLDGSQGQRHVLYFDKSRMEVNDPSADPASPWYVTNGLLPIELITGRLQVGYQQFEQRAPAAIAAIGDPGNFPTYADLQQLYQSPGQVTAAELGQPVTALLNPDRSIGRFDSFADNPATVLVQGDNHHGVPQVFVDFMHQRGPVYTSGRYRQDQIYDPLFVFGLPITRPYWVTARVGGVERPILFQVFERRILTYNPANPPAFQVEMGNVGQHYYQWRYIQSFGNHISYTLRSRFEDTLVILDRNGVPATPLGEYPSGSSSWSPDGQRVAFTGYRTLVNIYSMARDGTNITQLTDDDIRDHPEAYNDGASWSPDGQQIVFSSKRDGNRDLYRMQADGSQKVRLTTTPEEEELPMWSPDGRSIAFLVDANGSRSLEVMNVDGSGRKRLTDAALQLDTSTPPQWSPDSQQIAVVIEQAGVSRLYLVQADGSGTTPLLSDPVPNGTPAWSPDGKRIAFSVMRNQSPEIGIVNRDGTGFVQLTNDGGWNRSPVWSPDGRQLAFFSAQGGADNVYVMNDDGSNVIRVTRSERCSVGCAGPPDTLDDLHWLP